MNREFTEQTVQSLIVLAYNLQQLCIAVNVQLPGVCRNENAVPFYEVQHLSSKYHTAAAFHAKKYLKGQTVGLKLGHFPALLGVDEESFHLEVFAPA